MTTSHERLDYKVDGHVATITLTRPDILNRFDDTTTEELVSVIEKLRRPGDVRVLILASTGNVFSAGGDFDDIVRLAKDYDARMDAWEMGRRAIYGMTEIAVPVVVALQGDTYGLGTSIALLGDVVVASKNVKIGDPHVKVGLVAGDGGGVVFPAAFGMARAKRHLLTGDPIGAEDAYRLGGVSDLVEAPEDVLPLARKIAGKIAGLSPIAVQYTKRALNHAMQRQLHDVFEFSMALEQYSMGSEDMLEAVDAFRTKRAPVFRNR